MLHVNLSTYLLDIRITIQSAISINAKDTKIDNSLKSSANETLRIEDGVFRVHGSLVLGGVTNKSLLGRESDIGRCCPVTLCDIRLAKSQWRLVRISHGRWQ